MNYQHPCSPLILVNFLLILLLFGCTPPSSQVPLGEKKFFDLNGFIQQEIKQFEQQNAQLNKTVRFDAQSETQLFKEVDWQKELKLFLDADINKLAWQDQYELLEENSNIVYRAKDPSLKTKKLEIQYLNNANTKEWTDIQLIRISNFSENVLFRSNEVLTYSPPKHSYTIARKQKVASGEEEDMSISGKVVFN